MRSPTNPATPSRISAHLQSPASQHARSSAGGSIEEVAAPASQYATSALGVYSNSIRLRSATRHAGPVAGAGAAVRPRGVSAHSQTVRSRAPREAARPPRPRRPRAEYRPGRRGFSPRNSPRVMLTLFQLRYALGSAAALRGCATRAEGLLAPHSSINPHAGDSPTNRGVVAPLLSTGVPPRIATSGRRAGGSPASPPGIRGRRADPPRRPVKVARIHARIHGPPTPVGGKNGRHAACRRAEKSTPPAGRRLACGVQRREEHAARQPPLRPAPRTEGHGFPKRIQRFPSGEHRKPQDRRCHTSALPLGNPHVPIPLLFPETS